MTTINEKFSAIWDLVDEIYEENQEIGAIVAECFNLCIKTLVAVTEKGNRDEIDISEHIKIMSRALGVDLQKLVEQAMSDVSGQTMESQKEADATTLEFITSDLDDYEKFLAQNKVKESLDFLSKEI